MDLLGPGNVPNSTTVEPTDDRTFGSVDSFFQDCPPGTSSGGTFLSGKWFNALLDQIRSVIRAPGGVTIDNADTTMLLKAIRLLTKAVPYGTDSSGVAGTITVTLDPAPTSLNDGDAIRVKMVRNCLGANTITPNGLGPYTVVHNDGSALVPNDFVSGQILELRKSGSNMQIGRSVAPGAGSVTASALAAGAAPLPLVGTQTAENLHLSNDATNANRDADVTAGRVRDDGDSTNIQLAGGMVKRLDTAWAAGGAVGGTPQGGCDTGSKGNNQTWHAYAIGKLGMSITAFSRSSNVASITSATHGQGVGGTIRVAGVGGGFDGVFPITAVTTNSISYANGGADIGTTTCAATADGFDMLYSQSYPSPSMPSGWTVKQCLGSVLTDGSGNIILFQQYADEFWLVTPVADVSSSTGASTLRGLTVPNGVKVRASIIVDVVGTGTPAGGGYVYLSPPDITDQTASSTLANAASAASTGAGVSSNGGGVVDCWTNTSKQVRSNFAASGSASFTMTTRGYRDPRRRLF